MTSGELAQIQADIEAVNTAIRNFTNGDRVSEVRFADRTIKYSEITLPELTAERDRLISQLPASAIPAQSSQTLVRFTLSEPSIDDVIVPAGTRIVTRDGLYIFATTSDLTIPAGKTTGDVLAACQTPGADSNGYAAGYLDNLIDPIDSVGSVSNLTTTNGGIRELIGCVKIRPLAYRGL